MPRTINELEAEVNALDDVSSRSEYEDAFEHYVEVLRAEPEPDRMRMIGIIATLRNTLSNDNSPLLNIVRKKSRALDEALVADTIGDIIDGINNRNPALQRLKTKLQDEIDKGNSDAIRLRQIKNAVEKATNTIDEIKNLVDQLAATDATTKSRLKSLIEAAGNISNIILPNENNG
jgi:DNA repair ATPase RecN